MTKERQMHWIENFYLEHSFAYLNAYLLGAFTGGWMPWCLKRHRHFLLIVTALLFAPHLFFTVLYGAFRQDPNVAWRALSLAIAPIFVGAVVYFIAQHTAPDRQSP
ncbi:hypothetical protein J8I26_07235 [Herbaspirillum sp. LeCh32-8]|uniref:hypothetical protein n=1 Tax=Herbaspirillum sp. LeCh32-8 TaxID=2821356 RepID=UPI001AE78762|nr:hypothetical protein [Herbaspirillum sp. LeCh32-8]MBP0597887.1 hypothetical protein [Herbaspirillum sp. LeCh32-8]